MQHDHPLTVQHVLERVRGFHADGEVVTLTGDGKDRASYGEVAARVDRLCSGLKSLGVEPGDRVATFAWNSQHHLEAYLAIPTMGAVLHTLNIRLFAEQLTYIANHAQDKVVLVDSLLVDALAEHAESFETVERFVVMGGDDTGSLPNAMTLDELLDEAGEGFDYPEIDDRQAAGLCYTSGTTGNPKGVLYSHRSTMLQALAICLADGLGVSRGDRVMPVVPMFHANAWSLAHGAMLMGADMVMPSQFLQAEPLAKLIESEKVTVAGAVPTIWLDLLRYADEQPARPVEHPRGGLRRLRRAALAHGAVPGAPRHEDRAGLGHDRDQPGGLGGPPAAGRGGRGPLGAARHRRAPAALPRHPHLRRGRRPAAPRRRDHRRAGDPRAVDRQRVLRGPGRRGEVPRRLAAHGRRRLDRRARARSASPTARRTSSSRAASGSRPSTWRTS